jgi:fatty-acyl-CoA synthase
MLNTHMTMAGAFREVAQAHPRRTAMVIGEHRYHYGEMLERAQHLAAGFVALGLKKGDRAVVLLPPGYDFACIFFALAEMGGVFVPLNPQLRPLSLSHVLQNAQPRLMILEHALEPDSVKLPTSLGHILYTSQVVGHSPHLDELTTSSPISGESGATVKPEDMLSLLYTSGTTGQPKGTMHSHRSLIAPVVASLKVRQAWMRRLDLKNISQTARALARYKTRLLRVVGKPQTFLSTVAWHSITGIELMLQAFLMGDTLVVMRRFHPRQAMQLVQQEKVTVLVAVPTAFQVMLSLEDFDSYDTSSLLICGTGAMPCPPELGRQIQQRFHCALHIGFGSTETAGGIAIPSISDSGELQATTVGQPLPGVQVRIVDEGRNDLPSGQVGELLCKGDSIMLGYYGQPESTSRVIDEHGWYSTGDLAMLDEKGYLHIMGRKNDMIIRGGQNIYPVEIETYLASHPDIQEAAVIGVPSRVSGEEAWAFIILKPGRDLTQLQVLDFCRLALEPFKIPSQVRFVEDFPRTESGKPQKFQLQSDIQAEMRKDS